MHGSRNTLQEGREQATIYEINRRSGTEEGGGVGSGLTDGGGREGGIRFYLDAALHAADLYYVRHSQSFENKRSLLGKHRKWRRVEVETGEARQTVKLLDVDRLGGVGCGVAKAGWPTKVARAGRVL